MKKKPSFLIYLLLIAGVFLVVSSSCKKDKEKNDDIIAESFTDSRDGNIYQTVTIGEQVWMAENLKYLPSLGDSDTVSWSIYYVYDFNGTDVITAKETENYATYGVLYNWFAAMAGASNSNSIPYVVKGVCPSGWHLPSNDEWSELIDFLGGDSIAGGRLKEAGTLHWHRPNIGATNETGFTALPGGFSGYTGNFDNLGLLGSWWSSTQPFDGAPFSWNMTYIDSKMVSQNYGREVGLSVRCIKNSD